MLLVKGNTLLDLTPELKEIYVHSVFMILDGLAFREVSRLGE